MSKTVVVRYQTRADAAQENQSLIEQVFAELDQERPEGLRYAAFRLGEGRDFVHIAAIDGDNPLARVAAFGRFQRDIADRVVDPPVAAPATLVGSYRMLAGTRPAAAELAVAYIEAFGRCDLDAVAALLADDVVFESPRTKASGAAAVTAAIGEFARGVTGVDIVDAFGDDESAVIMYDMETGPSGTLRAVDRIVVRDGRIVSDTLVFDTRALER